MNPSFVVTLQEDEKGRLRAYLSKSQPNFDKATVSYKMNIEPPPLPRIDTRQNAITYGSRISKALRRHPAISRAIDAIYQTQAQDYATLMFEITAPAAECYRWETLCDEMNKFAAIDVACRVGGIR